VPGADVTLGGVTFEWEPSTPAGMAVLMAHRGTDPRLERDNRPRASQRKEAKLRRHAPHDDAYYASLPHENTDDIEDE
jgi:GTP-binding protein